LNNIKRSKTKIKIENNKLTPFRIIFNCLKTDKSKEKTFYNHFKEFVNTITSIEYIINELIEFKKMKGNLIEKKIIDNNIFIKNCHENVYDIIVPTSNLINE
jgi:hypothetical protein